MMPRHPTKPERQSQEKPGLLAGRWVLLATLAVALAVPAAVWVSVQLIESEPVTQEPGLVWAQREQWRPAPAKPTVLEAQAGPRPPFEARVRKELPFELGEAEHDLVRELSLAAWALAMESDTGAAAVIERAAERHPDNFYPTMLLALIRQQAGDAEAAQRLFAESFADAPVALKLRYVNAAGEPAANLKLGAIEIVCAQLQDGNLDETCRLVFPYLVTDAEGCVYLPVYETVYRAAELPQPVGREVEYRMPGWFEFPGRVGELPVAVVR